MGSIARAITSVVQPVTGGSTNFPTSGFGSGIGQAFQQLINQGALTPATGLPVTIPTPVTQPTQPVSTTPVRRFNAVVDPRLSRTMSRPMFRPSRYDGAINQLLERLVPNSSISRSGIESMLSPTPTREVSINTPTPPPSFSIQDYLNSSFSRRPTMGTQALVPITLPTGETYNLRSGGDASNFRDFLQSIGRSPQDIENIFRRRDELAMATGGKVNYQDGGQTKTPPKYIPLNMESVAKKLFDTTNLDNLTYNEKQAIMNYIEDKRSKKASGGIMNLKMGGTPVEMDLRAKGGFVPIGKKERADDVPARLSKNEFVFTAKAVRNAGNGDIREGARRMYNLMNKLEAKR